MESAKQQTMIEILHAKLRYTKNQAKILRCVNFALDSNWEALNNTKNTSQRFLKKYTFRSTEQRKQNHTESDSDS